MSDIDHTRERAAALQARFAGARDVSVSTLIYMARPGQAYQRVSFTLRGTMIGRRGEVTSVRGYLETDVRHMADCLAAMMRAVPALAG